MKTFFSIILITVLSISCFSEQLHAFDEHGKAKNSALFFNTSITVKPKTKIKEGQNLIYCAAFQASWNKLKDKSIKDDVVLMRNPKLVDFLNTQPLSSDQISQESTLALSGRFTNEFLAKIETKVKSKFGMVLDFGRQVFSGGLEIYLFSYFFRAFQMPMIDQKETLPIAFETGGEFHKVQAFEFFGKPDSDQTKTDAIMVLFYDNKDNFAISIKADNSTDPVILAKVPAGRTLKAAADYILYKSKEELPWALDETDFLKIPQIDFYMRHSIKDVERKFIKNFEWQRWVIRKAEEWLRFRLVDNDMIVPEKMSEEKERSVKDTRYLIFNKPFMILQTRNKSIHPYFMMWIENIELLKAE